MIWFLIYIGVALGIYVMLTRKYDSEFGAEHFLCFMIAAFWYVICVGATMLYLFEAVRWTLLLARRK